VAVLQYTLMNRQYIEQHNRQKQYIEQHNSKQYIEQHNLLISKSADRARLCEVYPGICLKIEEKQGKTSVRVAGMKTGLQRLVRKSEEQRKLGD